MPWRAGLADPRVSTVAKVSGALSDEPAHGMRALTAEAVAGAAKFAGGAGRGGGGVSG